MYVIFFYFSAMEDSQYCFQMLILVLHGAWWHRQLGCKTDTCFWLGQAWFFSNISRTIMLFIIMIIIHDLCKSGMMRSGLSVWWKRGFTSVMICYSMFRWSRRQTGGFTWKLPKDTVSSPSRGPRGRTRGSTRLWFETLLGRTLQISMWKLSVRQNSSFDINVNVVNLHTHIDTERIKAVQLFHVVMHVWCLKSFSASDKSWQWVICSSRCSWSSPECQNPQRGRGLLCSPVGPSSVWWWTADYW